MFDFLKRLNKLKKIEEVIDTSECGIKKRIDENRELIELLRAEAPAFIDEWWWVLDHLNSQEKFLVELMKASKG